jgi:hypothetical protein
MNINKKNPGSILCYYNRRHSVAEKIESSGFIWNPEALHFPCPR